MDNTQQNEVLLDLYNKIEYFLKDCIVHLNLLPRDTRKGESIQVIADNYFESQGFKTIGEAWHELDLDSGIETLKFVLESSLFFQEDFMNEKQSEAISKEFIGLVENPQGFLSTGLVDFELRELKESPVFLPPPHHEDYNLGLILYSKTQLAVLGVKYPVIY